MAEAVEYMKASDAAKLMGVSRVKMARMIDKGQLPYERDPYDARVKLIPLAAVKRYIQEHAQRRVVNPKASDLAVA